MTQAQLYALAMSFVKILKHIDSFCRKSAQQPTRISSFIDQSDKINEFNRLFRPDLETKIIIHGWRGSPQTDTVQNIKNAYLKNGLYNIIGKVKAIFAEISSGN